MRDPSEEGDDPLLIQKGPERPSDYTCDGPDSSEEYNPEKDKAGKRKRNNAKAMRRLRRKRKQRDREDRSSGYAQRTERRREGVKRRDLNGDLKKK